MKKLSILLPFVAALLLACGTVSTPVSLPTKTEAEPTREDPEASPTASIGFTRVRLYKSGGGFMDQLEIELANAARAGLRPFLEFDAEW
jgi:hypothetical protein